MSLQTALRHVRDAIDQTPDSEDRRRLHQAATLIEKAHERSRPLKPHQVVMKHYGGQR